MASRLTDVQQDSYVTQGLALGVLSQGVDWIPADKLAFEFASSHAWRSLPAHVEPELAGADHTYRDALVALCRQVDEHRESQNVQDGRR